MSMSVRVFCEKARKLMQEYNSLSETPQQDGRLAELSFLYIKAVDSKRTVAVELGCDESGLVVWASFGFTSEQPIMTIHL